MDICIDLNVFGGFLGFLVYEFEENDEWEFFECLFMVRCDVF